MNSSSNLYKYIYILILFNNILSYINEESNNQNTLNSNPGFLSLIQNQLTDEKTIDIEENSLQKINLTNKAILKLKYNGKNEKDMIFFSILSLDKNKNITIESNNPKINTKKNYFQIEINPKINPNPIINLICENCVNSTEVEVSSVVNYTYSIYKNINEKDEAEITIENNNFIKFITKGNKITVDIYFKDAYNDKVYYGIVNLPTNNTKYIPMANHFNGIKEEKINNKKEINFKFEDINNNEKDIKKYTAFIFSIINENTTMKYTVIINKFEPMNVFLIVSLSLAFVFAIITFFLIRRKQSYNSENEENNNADINNRENKEEN